MASTVVSEIPKKETQKKCCFGINLCNFRKNIKQFIREAKKPGVKDYKEVLRGHLVGVFLLGLSAYFIKVIHIPINNMVAGSDKQ